MRRASASSSGRGWGPFTSRQLTTIVCVAIVAAVLIPTAAMAAIGTFTSTTAAPAVTGTNSSSAGTAMGVQGLATGTNANTRFGVLGKASGANGIGVQGVGPKYGVFSNGPLGVAAGKHLLCTGCVGPDALSAAAKANPNLASGESESGVFGATGAALNDEMLQSFTFTRPVTGLVGVIYTATWPVTTCGGPGTPSPGYLCIYLLVNQGTSYDGTVFFKVGADDAIGALTRWYATNPNAHAIGSWTVTAP